MDQQFVDKITAWRDFYLKNNSSFWIYHKNGNFGRPHDANYALEDILCCQDSVTIEYDEYRQLVINNPIDVKLSRDEAGTIHLVFTGFDSLRVTSLDYAIDNPTPGDIKSEKIRCADDELRLVGNSPDIVSPESVSDREYQILFTRATVFQKW